MSIDWRRYSRALPLAAALIVLTALVGVIAQGSAEEIPFLQVLESPEIGQYVADGEGYSVYVNVVEGGAESCVEACAQQWLPVILDAEAPTLLGLESELLGSVAKGDGSLQATWAGRPLFRFAGDEEPGSFAGHGMGDAWYLVSPAGQPIAGQPDGEASQASVEELMQVGGQVYSRVCSQCHGRNGTLTQGGAAVLVNNPLVRDGGRVARQVMFGGQYMPAFGNVLSDLEVAAVVTYVRNSWGHDFGPFSEEEVAAERARFN